MYNHSLPLHFHTIIIYRQLWYRKRRSRHHYFSLSLSYFPHASTINNAGMGHAPFIRALSATLKKIPMKVITSMERFRAVKTHPSSFYGRRADTRRLKYTFLETLILISRCENNINVAYIGGVRGRDGTITSRDKPIFSDNAKQSLRFRIPAQRNAA